MTFAVLEKKLAPYQEPLRDTMSKWLYTHMPPRPLTGKRMYEHYKEVIEILMNELENAECGTVFKISIRKYLDSVTVFVEEFEKQEFKINAASAEEVLQFLMEQNGLTQYDIAEDVGGQPVVSEIFHGKRRLTREHIERLSKRFGVNPATFFI
ncbi:MAG: helix-turn-helix domain-containing protein [Candidatus Omnitrophica bacterium]|nr:helix-turn-helix domain-containing protein [Candidatus Omnitrophota bacterium]